jgi:nitroimidazol reductase NimA-like FMN-containing flavoprotein (pyridoxamine 5'-phosphate oxidase superfamily)
MRRVAGRSWRPRPWDASPSWSYDRPTIVPINFLLIDELIVIRTDPREKLSFLPLKQVCFEADGPASFNRVWSVVVHGLARDVTTALNERYEQMREEATVPTIIPLVEPHWIAIKIDDISGRRISRA